MLFLILNALSASFAWLVWGVLFYEAFKARQSKNALLILGVLTLVTFYVSFVYSAALAGIIDPRTIGPTYLRPVTALLMVLPAAGGWRLLIERERQTAAELREFRKVTEKKYEADPEGGNSGPNRGGGEQGV